MNQNKNNIVCLSTKNDVADQDLMPYLAACSQRDKHRKELAVRQQMERDAAVERQRNTDAIFREVFKEAVMCGLLLAFALVSIMSFVIPVG